jgi:hypothetical protein
MPSWRLVDAREIAARHKYTFYKPSADAIGKVSVGETVKLIFAFDSHDPQAPGAERMWVVVDAMDGDGGFTGRLDNVPCYIRDLALGDPISFREIHIINTQHDEKDSLVEKYLARCFVTNRVLKEGRPVGYLCREQPEEEKDSGWRVMAGDESDAYMDDAANIAYVSLGAVLNCDDSILSLLEAPVGAEYERDADGGFVAVDNAS